MRVSLNELIATGQPVRVGRTWCVNVARKDGAPLGSNSLVTFPTMKAAVAFANS